MHLDNAHFKIPGPPLKTIFREIAFLHLISELCQPITVKLCRLMGGALKVSSKYLGVPEKNAGKQKIKNWCTFSVLGRMTTAIY